MLTQEQEDIIKTDAKYSLVIAGAGCGKTYTIIKRVEYLIKMGVDPNKILIISFTNNTVNDLLKKINNVYIMTFHKLAISILKQDIKQIITDYDLNYYVKEFFKYNLTKKLKKYLNYYLDYDAGNLDQFYKRIISLINIYKANDGSTIKLISIYIKLYFNKKERYFLVLFYAFLCFYKYELKSYGGFDFNDLIIAAGKSRNKLLFDYVIVDEFQDTSLIRLKLLNKIVKDNDASLMCVGDDYQSIYQFSGSNLNIFVNFKTFYPQLKTYYLTKTFRNSQELVKVMGLFVMKNPLQLSKKMVSNKSLIKPIKIIYYRDLFKTINRLLLKYSDVMILGRNKKDNIGFSNFFTVHASKGLESENVIIINNRNDYLGFPNQIINDKISTNLINFKEIKYAEERRLFYVALTRTKNYVFLLVRHDEESIFIKELIKDYYQDIEIMEE